jgi:hypothetical protein
MAAFRGGATSRLGSFSRASRVEAQPSGHDVFGHPGQRTVVAEGVRPQPDESLPDADALHPAVLRPPAIPGALGDLEVPHHLGDVLPFIEQSLALTELADDLLGRVPVSLSSWYVLLPSMRG